MSDFEERIARLLPDARRRLAETLAEVAAADLPGGPSADTTSLVAYVVPAPNQHPEAHELREHIKRSLPDYMVPSSIVFLESMPRTPNGKIALDELADADITESEDGAGLVAPQTEIEQILVDIWSSVLGISEIGVHDNFFEIGGDSILSIRIVALAREAGLAVTPDLLFDHQTVASLAQVAEQSSPNRDPQHAVSGSTGVNADVDEDVPFKLTPIQHWFFEQGFAEPNHWNQSLTLSASGPIRFEWLQKAVDAVTDVHAMLRARFVPVEGVVACVVSRDRLPVEQVDLTTTPEGNRDAVASARISTAEASLDIEHGPVARVILFDEGPDGAGRLHIAAHHLVMDVLSWQRVVSDLSAAYQQASNEQPVRLDPPPATFRAWSGHLAERAATPDLRDKLSYWLADSSEPNHLLPADHAGQRFTEATAAAFDVVMTKERTTALLTQVPGVYGTQIDEVLLAALASTVGRWTGRDTTRVGLERHGRESAGHDIDVSETVGWFTSYFPVTLVASGHAPSTDPGGLLKSIKEQLRAVPDKGLVFGIGRYLVPDEETREAMLSIPEPPIIFNYAGRLNSPDGAQDEAVFMPVGGFASSRSPVNHRQHQLEVNAFVVDGELVVRWQYGTSVFAPATVEHLARMMQADVEALIDHCQSAGAGGYTPSDFPDIDLDQDDLDQLLGSL